jgi:thioredoxin reductase (NADPH)
VDGVARVVCFDDGTEVRARIVLVATGAWFRTLDLPSAECWNGAGVDCGAAHTEDANYQDRDVVVVRAANSAAQGLLFIARYARKVTVLIRGSHTTWSRHLDVDIRSNPKVKLRFNSELAEIRGDTEIREVDVKNN